MHLFSIYVPFLIFFFRADDVSIEQRTAMIRVFVSSYKAIHEPNEKLYYVYIIEVVNNGRSHKVEKRYSSFLVLHKQVSLSII